MSDIRLSDEKLKEKKIRILWDPGEDIQLVFANQLNISHAGGKEFHLTFGQLIPPIVFGLEEDEIPDSISVKPVAKIVVSPDVMQEFVTAMNDNYQRFKQSKETS
jgi:hypothetical protein